MTLEAAFEKVFHWTKCLVFESNKNFHWNVSWKLWITVYLEFNVRITKELTLIMKYSERKISQCIFPSCPLEKNSDGEFKR